MRLYQANGYLISIPAPAREATCLAPYAVTLEVISIPAPARGATFQSTGSPIAFLFQFPPLREGRQGVPGTGNVSTVISIPAPARGATPEPSAPATTFFISIPAPARGATRSGRYCSPCCQISIPAPARGATSGANLSVPNRTFQFPPLREGRPLHRRVCSQAH